MLQAMLAQLRGRPLGYLAAWLMDSNMFLDKDSHVRFDARADFGPAQDQRSATSAWARINVPEFVELERHERARRDG